MSIARTTISTVKIPTLGIGCWQSQAGEVGQAIKWALEAGVRLIDTAFMYGNEMEIGQALKEVFAEGRNVFTSWKFQAF